MLRSLVTKMTKDPPKQKEPGTPKNLEAELAAAAVAEGLKTPLPEGSDLKNVGLSAKKELNDEDSFFSGSCSLVVTPRLFLTNKWTKSSFFGRFVVGTIPRLSNSFRNSSRASALPTH